MKEIAISVFKAKCLGLLEEVRKTRKPIRVTRFGEPVAEVFRPRRNRARSTGLDVWRARSKSWAISSVRPAASTIGKPGRD